MSVIIITFKKFSESAGGVAKHAEHLKLAFPEAKHYSFSDLPNYQNCLNAFEPTKAFMLNIWLRDSGKVKPDDVIISDGFWHNGLEDYCKNIISVIHGTFAGWIGQSHPLAKAQAEIITKASKWIAVSPFAQYEAEKFYGVKSRVILNGVDLDKFCPDTAETIKDIDLVNMSVSADKGAELCYELSKHFNSYSISGKNESEVIQYLQRSKVYIHPSRYEGNAFSICEAASVGLAIISSPVGLFWPQSYNHLGLSQVGVYLEKEATIEDWKKTIQQMLSNMNGQFSNLMPSRAWAERNISLKKFIREWKKVI